MDVNGELVYRLAGGLNEAQLDDMHEKAMGLIEEMGLEVAHEGIKGRLADFKGVHIDGDRVTFDRELVEEKLAQLRYEPWAGFKITAGAYELNVTDLETGKIRPSTYSDLVDLLKLCDSYGLEGCAPAMPLDLPVPLQEIAMYKACFEHSRAYGWGYGDQTPKSTVATARCVYEMCQVVDKPFSLGLWIISPFKAAPGDLDVICDFLDQGIDTWVATMPITGMTAPIHLIGAYIQSLAELFAGYTLLCLVNQRGKSYCSIMDSVRAYPTDMKYGSFVYGSPEDALATMIQIPLNRRYGIPVIAKSLLTTAKEPDAHAAAEKTAHTLAAMLAGVDGFCDPGLLSVDEIMSAEQVVIDMEILEYCARFSRGLLYNDETSSVKSIAEVGAGGSFLTHDTTLAHYREAFWTPALFEHTSLGTWRERGAQDVTQRARAIAQRRIAEHEYEIEENKRRELERIYRHAESDLL